jgi:hypothetical protein
MDEFSGIISALSSTSSSSSSGTALAAAFTGIGSFVSGIDIPSSVFASGIAISNAFVAVTISVFSVETEVVSEEFSELSSGVVSESSARIAVVAVVTQWVESQSKNPIF